MSNELRGATLRQVIAREISLQIKCNACGRRTAWAWRRMKSVRSLADHMDQQMYMIADKLTCAHCGARNLHVQSDKSDRLSW